MSLANLGASAGSKAYGLIAKQTSFDAVELTDLATVSVSDFFKRIVTPART